MYDFSTIFIIGLLSECITVEVWISRNTYTCIVPLVRLKNVYVTVHSALILIVCNLYNSRKYILQK